MFNSSEISLTYSLKNLALQAAKQVIVDRIHNFITANNLMIVLFHLLRISGGMKQRQKNILSYSSIQYLAICFILVKFDKPALDI